MLYNIIAPRELFNQGNSKYVYAIHRFSVEGVHVCTVYLEILAVIKFGNLPEIWPSTLLAELKFSVLPK